MPLYRESSIAEVEIDHSSDSRLALITGAISPGFESVRSSSSSVNKLMNQQILTTDLPSIAWVMLVPFECLWRNKLTTVKSDEAHRGIDKSVEIVLVSRVV
jgi:hypothetical protein